MKSQLFNAKSLKVKSLPAEICLAMAHNGITTNFKVVVFPSLKRNMVLKKEQSGQLLVYDYKNMITHDD